MMQEEYTEHKCRDLNLVLQVLQEEAAELIQVSSKIVRFGLNSANPFDPQYKTNWELFHQELGDLLAIVDILDEQTEFNIDKNLLSDCIGAKTKKLETYLPYKVQ